MKKTTLIAMVALAMVTVSCSKEETTIGMVSAAKSGETAPTAGEIHNRAMRYVYSNMLADASTLAQMNSQDLAQYAINKVSSYLTRNCGYTSSQIDDILEDYVYDGNGSIMIDSDGDLPFSISSRMFGSDTAYYGCVSRILDVIDHPGAYSTQTDFNQAIKKVERQAWNRSCEDMILTIGDIAISSYDYWYNNVQDWVAVFNEDNSMNQVPDEFWDIMVSDAHGAVAGTLRGLFWGPMGWLAGACIGSCLYSGVKGIVVACNNNSNETE